MMCYYGISMMCCKMCHVRFGVQRLSKKSRIGNFKVSESFSESHTPTNQLFLHDNCVLIDI